MHVAYIHMHIYALMTVIKIMMVVMLLLMMIKMKIIIINLSGQRVCGIFNEHATPPQAHIFECLVPSQWIVSEGLGVMTLL